MGDIVQGCISLLCPTSGPLACLEAQWVVDGPHLMRTEPTRSEQIEKAHMLDFLCELLWHVLEQPGHHCHLERGYSVDHLLEAHWNLPHPAEQWHINTE